MQGKKIVAACMWTEPYVGDYKFANIRYICCDPKKKGQKLGRWTIMQTMHHLLEM